MALELSPAATAGPGIRVALSPLIDFNFGIFVLNCHGIPGKHKREQPWTADFLTSHPDLVDAINAFWETPDYPAWDEMLVVAHATGMLFDPTPDRFLAALPTALERAIPVPPLETETPEVVAHISDRLQRLRESHELRRRYVTLLRDAWAAIEPYWTAQARPAARQFAASFKIRLGLLEDLRAQFPGCTMLRQEAYEAVIRRAIERGEVVVVPLGLGGEGQLVFDLPGVFLVGVGLEANRKVQRKREAAERVAGRFKILADPTRVSILMQLLHMPLSITDIAAYFELSQPTVSVHMKALREAGLVESEKSGNSTRYRARREVIEAFIGDAVKDLGAFIEDVSHGV